MPISFRSSRKPLVERPLSRISESLCWTRGWLTRFTILAVIRLLSRWRARDFVQVACPAYTGRMRATRRHRQAAAAWGASAAAPDIFALVRSWKMPYRKLNLTVRELPPLLDDWCET